jgi:DNA-binding transcriptional LysR family regulator
MSSAEQFRALEGRKMDLGFVGLRPALSGYDHLLSECIAHERILVALPERHPLAKKGQVRLAELASQFFIGMSAQTHPGAREWLLDTCQHAHFVGRILQEADGEAAAIKFVADGLGVALVPEQISRLSHDGVVFLPLNPPLQRESHIAWRADNPSKSLQNYIKIVKDLRGATDAHAD